MNSKYRILFQLSTVQHLLTKAKAISSLAEAHLEDADILSACVAVILAAALDQGITDVLSGYEANYAFENEVPISATRDRFHFGTTSARSAQRPGRAKPSDPSRK